MFGSITNYEQKVYLNGQAISGISAIEGSYNLKYKPINTIGNGFSKQIISEVAEASFSINRALVYDDPFLRYTGELQNNIAESFACSLNYGTKSFGFLTGYLDSFSMSCAVGEVPKTQTSIKVFNDIGSGYSATGSDLSPYMCVPQVKDIKITCNNSSTNRIKSFSLDISCPKEPIYAIQQNNAQFPIEVHSKMPIQVDCSFLLEMDPTYELRRMYDELTSETTKNFTINIRGNVFVDQYFNIQNTGTTDELTFTTGISDPLVIATQASGTSIFSFNSANAKLISEQESSADGDFSSVKLVYRTYLMS